MHSTKWLNRRDVAGLVWTLATRTPLCGAPDERFREVGQQCDLPLFHDGWHASRVTLIGNIPLRRRLRRFVAARVPRERTVR